MNDTPITPAQQAQIVAILDAANDLVIATNREDGWPQATAVSFVNEGLAIYFGTWGQSQKAKNIARDDRVSISITDAYKSWDDIKGVSLAGRARRISDSAELQRVFALMLAKFPQISQYAQTMSGEDMAIIRIDPVVVSILDYSKGFGTTQSVRAA